MSTFKVFSLASVLLMRISIAMCQNPRWDQQKKSHSSQTLSVTCLSCINTRRSKPLLSLNRSQLVTWQCFSMGWIFFYGKKKNPNRSKRDFY
jgi:RNase P subunit RPR2